MRARLIVCWRVGVHTKSGLFRGSGGGGHCCNRTCNFGAGFETAERGEKC